jgi:hypothetical protein
MEKGDTPVEKQGKPSRESELEKYMNRVFDDLLIKDNGGTQSEIEAYYFLRVLVQYY